MSPLEPEIRGLIVRSPEPERVQRAVGRAFTEILNARYPDIDWEDVEPDEGRNDG